MTETSVDLTQNEIERSECSSQKQAETGRAEDLHTDEKEPVSK